MLVYIFLYFYLETSDSPIVVTWTAIGEVYGRGHDERPAPRVLSSMDPPLGATQREVRGH